jgi:molybdate transport system ATP-binding protein
MNAELAADFEKRYPGGPTIHAALRCPCDGPAVTVLFGPSGSGKTTVLRCLAGLERPERGVIRFAADTWFDAEHGIALPPRQRGIGYVFQEYALFPHLTVAGNITYGLPRSLAQMERKQRLGELTAMLDLTGLESRYPRQLSGGQQQRVALARALAPRPRLLLLDEPLSALDAPTREQVRRELRHLLADLRLPAVLVTHDRVEALALGDYVAVLDRGRVCQWGPVPEVFTRPADLAVARIVGVETVEPARIVRLEEGLAEVVVGGARLVALAEGACLGDAYVCIRAEDVLLEKGLTPPSSARNRLAARVRSLDREGPLVRVGLDCGFPLAALITRQACLELDLHEGDAITALVKAPAIHLIARA